MCYKLHFIPTYCPHLDPAERLWGLMRKHVTHNRCHATFADFKTAILTFLRQDVPRKWDVYCDQVTDNFRIISPKDFRVLTSVPPSFWRFRRGVRKDSGKVRTLSKRIQVVRAGFVCCFLTERDFPA